MTERRKHRPHVVWKTKEAMFVARRLLDMLDEAGAQHGSCDTRRLTRMAREAQLVLDVSRQREVAAWSEVSNKLVPMLAGLASGVYPRQRFLALAAPQAVIVSDAVSSTVVLEAEVNADGDLADHETPMSITDRIVAECARPRALARLAPTIAADAVVTEPEPGDDHWADPDIEAGIEQLVFRPRSLATTQTSPAAIDAEAPVVAEDACAGGVVLLQDEQTPGMAAVEAAGAPALPVQVPAVLPVPVPGVAELAQPTACDTPAAADATQREPADCDVEAELLDARTPRAAQAVAPAKDPADELLVRAAAPAVQDALRVDLAPAPVPQDQADAVAAPVCENLPQMPAAPSPMQQRAAPAAAPVAEPAPAVDVPPRSEAKPRAENDDEAVRHMEQLFLKMLERPAAAQALSNLLEHPAMAQTMERVVATAMARTLQQMASGLGLGLSLPGSPMAAQAAMPSRQQ